MKLFTLTNRKTSQIKMVKANNSFDARWLAGKSRNKISNWECKEFNDPYEPIGAKSYWKLYVPATQRPDWVKDKYGLA